jgi:pimeloyl-ACP methyl ester carboxylesterase
MRSLVFVCLLCTSLIAFGQELPRRGIISLGLRAVPADLQTKHSLKPQSAIQIIPGPDGKVPDGLKDGDIVVEIAGKTFATFGQMNEIIREQKVGTKIPVKVLADGKTETRTVTIIERPRDKREKYDVIYDHVNSYGHRIRTIVSKPKAAGKHPVLFWIQGINVGSIDSPLTSANINSKMVRAFADDYVTVRVEKPGVGDSEGGPAQKVAFDEELDIYRQALKALDKYEFVDRSRVYIFGHSMGGCHAPILAAEIPIKGIVTYGTVSDSWLEWQIKAERWQSLLGGADPAEVDKSVRQTVAFYSALYNEKKAPPQIVKEHPDLAEYAKQASPDGENLSARSIKYMTELNDKNFGHYWSRIGDAKVLALFGENDFVSLEADQSQIPMFVNRVKPGNAKFMKVKDSDHGFTKTTSFQDSMQKTGKPGNEFNPETLRVMKEWIAEIEKGG